jgi:hypothetical protein
MTKSLTILFLITFISSTVFSQGFLDKVRKETQNKILKGTLKKVEQEVLKLGNDWLNSNSEKTKIQIGINYLWVDSINEYCQGGGRKLKVYGNVNRPETTNAIGIDSKPENYYNFFEFYNCDRNAFQNSSSNTNKKAFDVAVQCDLEQNIVITSVYFNPTWAGGTKEEAEWYKEKSKTNYINCYSLVDNDKIILKQCKKYEDLISSNFIDSTTLLVIKNKELVTPEGKLIAKIIGPDNNRMVFFPIVAYLVKEEFTKVSKVLKEKSQEENDKLTKINMEIQAKQSKIDAENKKIREANYLKETKNCFYCSIKYTGVSFDFWSFRSKNKCSDKIYEVYYSNKSFCSRKCALDHCNATN